MKDKIEELIELLKSCSKEDFNVIELEILEYNIDTVFNEISQMDGLTKDDEYQLKHLYDNAKKSIAKQIDSLSTRER